MAKAKAFDYPGERATVTWHGRLCIHVGECGRATGDLFVAGRKPWCQPDTGSDEEVQDVVLRCPTGALSARFEDDSWQETADAANSVHVACNGPLFVRGDLRIEGAPDDVPGLSYRAALCRCGKSNNKPFCDNSHEAAGFRDYGAVGESGTGGGASGGPLKISPAKDGPLLLSGNLSIFTSAGRRAYSGSRAALCRCGASENKPFCDGKHKKVGFQGD